ncbi:MAG: hypothetical protein ACLFT6_03740 [Bacteroidales bacterium]
MNKINRNNYEIYFIDYLDGTINHQDKEELMTFLRENPDLKSELELLSNEDIGLSQNKQITFPHKINLFKKAQLKNEEHSHIDELCIAKLEGDLKDNEEKEFDRLITSNKNTAETYKLYQKTKIKADKSIVFPNKNNLKRHKTVFLNHRIKQALAYAAGILLLVALITNTSTNNTNNYDKYLSNNDIYLNLPDITPHTYQSEFKQEIYEENIINSYSNNNNLSPNIINKTTNAADTPMQKIQPVYAALSGGKSPLYAGTDIDLKLKNNPVLKQNRHQLLAKTPQIQKENKSGNSTLLDLAEMGFNGISKITGKELALERKYDEKGNLKQLAFKSESFMLTTNVNKK